LPLFKCLCFSSHEQKQESRKFSQNLCNTSGFIYMFDFKHIRHENPPYGFILVDLGCFHVVPGRST
ncbi:hypothetical protein P8777_16445, partial [Bacillus subtilis]|uniref:hypothetical protein n=1 Tax=Bacillus subtilis TaxID=1423 RepID=UPI002DBA5D7A